MQPLRPRPEVPPSAACGLAVVVASRADDAAGQEERPTPSRLRTGSLVWACTSARGRRRPCPRCISMSTDPWLGADKLYLPHSTSLFLLPLIWQPFDKGTSSLPGSTGTISSPVPRSPAARTASSGYGRHCAAAGARGSRLAARRAPSLGLRKRLGTVCKPGRSAPAVPRLVTWSRICLGSRSACCSFWPFSCAAAAATAAVVAASAAAPMRSLRISQLLALVLDGHLRGLFCAARVLPLLLIVNAVTLM